MKKITNFTVNESEKNRIRKLHKKFFLKEQGMDRDEEIVSVVDTGVDTGVDSFSDASVKVGDEGPVSPEPNEKQQQQTSSNIPCVVIINMLMGSSVPQFQSYPTTPIDALCHKCNTHYQSHLGGSSQDWNQYGAAGQQICLMLINNPQCCTAQQTMWKCSPTGTCTQDPNGQFQTQQDCINSGCGDVYCTDCQGGTMTMGTAGVCPQGYAPNPGTPGSTPPSPICYECDGNGNCIGPGWAMGPNSFNSQNDCQNSPTCQPPTDWECVNGQCVQQVGGQYATQQDCQQFCPPPPNMWECDTNNGCSQTPTGTYNSQSQCETACCQDVINNWNWAQGSQTNPCQKFYVMFGPMGSTNPNTLPFNQECIYNYLLNLILNLGGPCVSGNFINLLNNFATGNNGCYGNPASGCVNSTASGCPHQNSICGKLDQFCNITNPTPGKFFKCQYAIWFANSTGCDC